MSFDAIVLGGGSGGLAWARRAALHGAKVALVEQKKLGGTCVHVGCVPKKVMWNTASVLETVRDAKHFGCDVSLSKFDFTWVKHKRDAYIQRLDRIYESNVDKQGITRIHGTAKFTGKNTIAVNGEVITGKHILIATGSYPILPRIPGVEHAITSDGFFDIETLPKKAAIVGSGYIAVELAGVLNTLGTETHLFIRKDSLLNQFDDMIRKNVETSYIKDGVTIVKDSNVTSIKMTDTSSKSLEIVYTTHPAGEDGPIKTHTDSSYDIVLFAIGRAALTDPLNLGCVDVKMDPETGYIVCDAYQNTSTENIYALGDVCGNAMLTPVAISAGRRLADRIFGGPQYQNSKLDYSDIPTVIFSHPTAGTVGLSERDAKAKYGADKIKVYETKFTNMYYSNFEPEHKPFTQYKLVTLLPTEKVLGLHLFGKASDEILQGFGVAMKMGATKNDFDSCVAIHPTASEELVTMR